MAGADHSSVRRPAAVLLVASFVVFAAGAILPGLGEHGNGEIFTLPVLQHLLAVAANPVAWRWTNVLMGTAVVVWIAGLTVLTVILEGVGEQVLSRLGWAGSVIAATLWLIFSAFRAVVTVAAAGETATTGIVPVGYPALSDWAFALFWAYAVVGFLALAAYGASVLRIRLLASWVGWATVIFSLAMLVVLLIVGDTLPAFHYVPSLLIGIMLFKHRER